MSNFRETLSYSGILADKFHVECITSSQQHKVELGELGRIPLFGKISRNMFGSDHRAMREERKVTYAPSELAKKSDS
jgi:hypothetical protein